LGGDKGPRENKLKRKKQQKTKLGEKRLTNPNEKKDGDTSRSKGESNGK